MALVNGVSTVKFVPVILAGGSGTRFWPRSRKALAKQVLALDGDRTLIQQTLERLLPLAKARDIWVITNSLLAELIGEQLPELDKSCILAEPAARNTAPACALAAFLLERSEPDTVIGIFPSDQVVKDKERFIEVIEAGIALAQTGDKIVVLGVPPTRAETGYGYIEQGEEVCEASAPGGRVKARRVRRFVEKPDSQKAAEYVSSGNYAWNGGIFLWSARTLADSIRRYCPNIAPFLEAIAAAYGTEMFDAVFEDLYPQCENISIDYAVLEPRSAEGEEASEIYCLPADFGWNDLGSWAALHEHQSSMPTFLDDANRNVIEAPHRYVLEAFSNYVYAPGRTVALVGVDDLVVVQTDDALLITTRGRSQDVGKIVRALTDAGRNELV
jgi:mannose-1-phosphate guanylyltransferase